MGLFGNKKKAETPSLFLDDDEPATVDYNSVTEYLTGLSDKDYETICQVATIYRKAEQDVSAALGVANEPTTFIHPPKNSELVPQDVNHIEPETAFLDDITAPKNKSAKSQKIDVQQ